MITVATDGSCLGNPGPAAWAWFVSDEAWQSGFLGRSTNNVAELSAILNAATVLPAADDVLCLVDSQYAIRCLSRGGDGWLAGWERSGKLWDDHKLANAELIRAAVSAIDARPGNWRFQWVKGHADDPLNLAVDRLANTAASSGRVTGGLTGPGWVPGCPDQAAIPDVPAPPARPRFTMTSRRDSPCFECGGWIRKGQVIARHPSGGWQHAACPPLDGLPDPCPLCPPGVTPVGVCEHR